ncbi:MAG: hypothetical protein FIA94_07625 [Nitrospirae bacterium]|nr:hypothetical protein [Nitrospirota bacterium]
MNRNKVCPVCRTEYYPHIEKCSDCGALLLSPEEFVRAQEERKLAEETVVGTVVKVLEGDLNWMSELRTVLLDAGIPCNIQSDAGCRKGCCGNTVQLTVAPEDFKRAQETIEEYLMELDPDLRIAREMFGKGKCPACGSSFGPDARECPDCGLPLLISGEED